MKVCCLTIAALLSFTLSAGVLHAQVGFDPMIPGGDIGGLDGGGRGPGGAGRGGNAGQQQIKQLQAQLAEEQKALKEIEDDLFRDFQQDQEWKDAQAAQEAAQAEHEAARTAVLSKVYESAEYKAALDEKFAAESALETLNAGGDASPEELQAATNAISNASIAVRLMEDKALGADPKVTETKQRLTEANAKMNELRKQFRESLELNERYLAQSDRVEDVKFKLADARDRMAQQSRQKSESSRRQSESKRRSNRPSGRRPSGGGVY